jgi:hypothetical protein
MIELYVLVSLAAVGYIVNNQIKKTSPSSQQYSLSKGQMPSPADVYHSQYFQNAQNITNRRADQMYKASQKPIKTGVIDKNFGFDKERHMQSKIKSLTGEYVAPDSFKHNNMIPYFGGRIRQNMDDGANSARLEAFTGSSQDAMYKQKCEVGSFYDMKKDVGNVNGSVNQDDYYRERMVQSRMRNNETPVEKIYVGPGLGKGFTSKPDGGFHQVEMQDYIKPKCVDELRAANKPKVTFEGRVVDGVKTKMRGDVGKFDKNRPDTYYEQTEDRLFKTTGANLKPSQIPEFNVKPTHRLDTNIEYQGTATAAGKAKARALEPGVRLTDKDQYGEYGLRNPALQNYGKGTGTDYGKSTIMVYANERDITTTRVHQGNLISLVKAIVAPVQDLFKDTKKDEFVDNPRHFGNMNVQIPEKPATYDPNDMARTTIKETTIHESVNANLKGSEKITVYDPNDVARTTTKETTIHDAVNGNLKGAKKITVYDPNDIARTTIKETLIHDDMGTGTVTGAKQLFVYDPDEIAKATIRETLERMDYEMNISGGAKKSTVYDPNDKARTTMKETTEDKTREGNIDRVEGMGDYSTTDFTPHHTQKQFLSDNDYIGAATRTLNEGYQTNEFEARNTQKQFLSDHDYYGGAESRDKKQKSYDDMYNAFISSGQESLLESREPTQIGPKTALSKDCVNMSNRKQACDNASTRETNNIGRVNATQYAGVNETGVTKTKKEYGTMDVRLDPSLLEAYMKNPYTHPLNSVV